MAFAAPQRYRAPNGGSVFLPPEVAEGLVGLEPDLPPVAVDTPAIPTPPPIDQGMLAAPPVLAPPEEPTFSGAVADVVRPELVRDLPGATGPAQSPPPAPRPVPPPVTAADIRAGGYAPVLEQQREASTMRREAGAEQIAVDTRGAEEEARALAASGERDEAREAERARIQQETIADIAQRSAAIDSEIDRIANTKIDASIRNPVVSAIAMAMGAIGQALAGKTDGSNPALDMILKQRDANVQRQLAERDSAVRTVGLRRDQLAGMRQRLTDSNALYDGLAAAETRRIRNELGRVAASTKSASGQANLMRLDADLAADEATHLAGAKDKQFAFDDREKQRIEQERSNREAERARREGLAEQRAGRMDRRTEFGEEMAYKYASLDSTRQAAIAKAKSEGNTKEAEDLRKYGVPGVKNKDGSVPKARDEKTAGQLTAKIKAAGEINDIINEVLAIRDNVGGEIRALNSDESQKLQALQARLNIVAKEGTEGLSSENDMKLLAGAVGAADIQSLRSRTAGLKAGRDRTTAALNRELRLNFPEVDPVKFANMYEKTPAQTAEEKQFSTAIQKPKLSIDAAETEAMKLAKEQIRAREGLGPTALIPEKFNDEILAAKKQAAAEYKEIAPATRALIQMHGGVAARPGAQGDASFKMLLKLSEQGETRKIREAALEALQQAGAASGAPTRDDSGNTIAVPAGTSTPAEFLQPRVR